MNKSGNPKTPFDIQQAADKIAKARGFPGKLHPGRKETPSKGIIPDRTSNAYLSIISRDLVHGYLLNVVGNASEAPGIDSTDMAFALNRAVQDLQRQLTKYMSPQTEIISQIGEMKTAIKEIQNQLTELMKGRREVVEQLVETYVRMVRSVEVVKQVLLTVGEDAVTVWTIIDAAPFQDEFRIPIYDSQARILKTCDATIPLDFRLVNISEIPNDENQQYIISPDAKTIWSR